MNKKFKIGIIGLVIVSFTVILVVFGLNATTSNDEDLTTIEKVLVKSATVAENTYIDANKSKKDNTLKDKKDSIVKMHSANFDDVFSDKIGARMKSIWIDRQVEGAQDDTEDLVDCGVSNIAIKDFSIKEDTADVTAVLSKYLIDRVKRDGVFYLDKMEGTITIKASLVKKNDKWKITEYESIPDLGDTTHKLTKEK